MVAASSMERVGAHLHRCCPNWLAVFVGRYRVDERGCWIWEGHANPKNGYGHISFGPRGDTLSIGAHRFSWFLHRGAIPGGLYVLHRCDTPLCVNPAHLFLGTAGDNIRDAVAKGRQRNQNTGRTHCRRGHTLMPENVYEWRGMRRCLRCRADYLRRYRGANDAR